MTMVAVREVRKVYRQGDVEVPALSGVSLSIDPGAFLALAGPSGSGKTTLLNLIGGLDVPDDGKITVDGRDLGTLSATALTELRLHRIGFVFQAYNLIPVLTAVENAEYVMLLQGVPKQERRERAMAVLDEVGLSGLYHRKPAELSGGQQQRVAVARAVVSRPAIVLADEPTANLDSATGEGLLAMMREMNEARGVTFVFSTHDAMVMDAARKVIRMKDGRLDGDKGL
ncbi:ABC transporter ATP-binding protein [Desulfoluna spongiiphila]|uniref:Putative ABC transport system ATP-binding protein n=1 Tax=Desulfoluna spongiiphila TaxID=419481 RepID=A0A1G5JF82_9BACT|nr:ABC transporter ATP-binding protein [Desulfoluna spongiiphila]SCY86561.1 putative ABC transport system ATP-binding protein [Desulfoluna spongiiphila]VVS93088.1 abc transporter-like [Desulfoluna spongiiphila]